MADFSVKTLSCEGDPYTIGFMHGNGAAAEIHANIKTYTGFFQETAKVSWAEAKERATSQFAPMLQKRYPEILEEMNGIAAGAGGGLTMEDILTLNVRSEISLTHYTDGCTAISEKSAHGEVFLAQNWDWLEELRKGMVLFNITTERPKTAMKFLGEAGLVGKIGMNSFGVGLCSNAIRSGTCDSSKFPVHVMARRLLQYASSVDDALSIIDEFDLASTTNFMIADKGGNQVDVECSPLGNVPIWPSNEFVAHTNHLCGLNRPDGMVDFPAQNSFSRLARMEELTHIDIANHTATSFESLKARFSDQQGSPFSIHRTRPPGATGMERMLTLSTIIMDVTKGTAQVFFQRPVDRSPDLQWSFEG